MDEDEAVRISVIACICQTFGRQWHSQLIGTVGREVVRHVNCEVEVAAAIEASILAIDVNPCFVVDGSEVQMCPLASPVCRHIE